MRPTRSRPWSGLPVLLVGVLLSTACARGHAPLRTEPSPGPAPDSIGTPSPASAQPSGARPGTLHALLAAKGLIVPVEGVAPARVRDSYTASRGGRTHDAVDIMAPRGTPVLAADSGSILKLRRNDAGGLTIYQLDHASQFVYYYAHLDRYQEGLAEGQRLRQGQVIGYVGTTGNAPKDAPHLHFQVMLYRGNGQYWGGEPVNPHPFFTRPGRRP
ncbi:MAG: M23 family metallopeptidase [Gemmatimonadaceae bacterium]|nr:M23 family metallopeptidase [Gemmatimonadaceae bacterium]